MKPPKKSGGKTRGENKIMNVLWAIVPLVTSVVAVLMGASKMPQTAIPADSDLGKYIKAGNTTARLFKTWFLTGLMDMFGWSKKVALPKIQKPIDQGLSKILWTAIVCGLLIFAGFALEVYWLSQAIAGILLFFSMFLFIFLHGKKADKDEKGGFWGFSKDVAFSIGQGIGVFAMILVSLVLIQWGISDLVEWTGYAVWGGYLVGVGVFILTRLLGHTGFTGLTFMFLIAFGCFLVGLATRMFPVETGNLFSQYNLLREEIEQNTAANNANANQTFVIVKEEVSKYESLGKVGSWSLFSSTEQKTGTVIVKMKRLAEKAAPGTYRRLDQLQYKTKTGTDIFVRVAKPADDGTVLDEKEFYIPLNPAKVEVAATEKKPESKSESIPLKIKYADGLGWTTNPPSDPPCQISTTLPASVQVSADGSEMKMVLPSNLDRGLASRDTDSGKEFVINTGDEFEVVTTGTVKFSNDHPCVGGDGMRGWLDTHVDSPFAENVGGLEFSIGGLEVNRYLGGTRYSGTAQFTGVFTARVIEQSIGYGDDNAGNFTVTVKIVKRATTTQQPQQ